MNKPPTALLVRNNQSTILPISVRRTGRPQQQISLKIGDCSLYLYGYDAIQLCNNIVDQVEK